MAALVHSGQSHVSFEVGEYQQFSTAEAEVAAAQKSPRRHLRLTAAVLLSFGFLCVLQAVLNISLRLSPSQSKGEGATGEDGCPQGCPQGWLGFGSSCYFISSGQRSWNQSRRDCLQRNADLVIINSQQEQAFLTGFTTVAWVGMTDRQEEGTWLWVDGTPVDRDGLLWAPGQPDDAFGGEDCGDLHTLTDFIGLNDFNCSRTFQWICEKTLK